MFSQHDDEYFLLPEDPDRIELHRMRDELTELQSEAIRLHKLIKANENEFKIIHEDISRLTAALVQTRTESYVDVVWNFFSTKTRIGYQLDDSRIASKAKQNEIESQHKKYDDLKDRIEILWRNIVLLNRKNPDRVKSSVEDYSPPSVLLS